MFMLIFSAECTLDPYNFYGPLVDVLLRWPEEFEKDVRGLQEQRARDPVILKNYSASTSGQVAVQMQKWSESNALQDQIHCGMRILYSVKEHGVCERIEENCDEVLIRSLNALPL